ncbi:flagellin [Aestuariibius sp. 2305UL40-4]|uniref:flagellin N-terminal helical domain-containing protein n=1 Tax=Aestuariibius violaceus TaxID=3234132 RepID=UPI00345E991A
MSSILTNNSAMVALQTLKTINNDLAKTQSMISTGKEVANARDNASVWAISKVMEADVKGFQSISDSLSLGQSTVAVARNASETVTDLLTDIKGKIVAAQEDNVDRDKIQTDIDALTNQIKSVTSAAQFNGLNLVSGTDDMKILSSLDRGSDGSVVASDITVSRQDLTTDGGAYGGGGVSKSANGTVSAATVGATGNTASYAIVYNADTDVFSFTIEGNTVNVNGNTDTTTTIDNIASAVNALGLEGISASNDGSGNLDITSTRAFEDVDVTASVTGSATIDGGASDSDTIGQRAETITFVGTNVNQGDSYRITYNGANYDYVAGKGETFEDVARGLQTALDSAGLGDVSTRVSQNDSGQWVLNVDNAGTDVTDFALTGESGGTASGGLFGLDSINVSTSDGADRALATIETLIGNSIDAAANFGSSQGRIDTQQEFIDNLTDALKSGIGAMVDADMEAASARLQALQVQQQLGVQSLSIANQAPQSILSLFR